MTDSDRHRLLALLGDLPDRDRPIRAKTISKDSRADFDVETLELDLNGIELVPAYFVKPPGARGHGPTVLYNHWHGGEYKLGKEQLFRGEPSYATSLTSAGYRVLCIDHWAFGVRSTRSEGEIFKRFIWAGRVMWGMMVFDSIRALDYLATRDDVDTDRIGTIGMSMGSTMAWWLAALDERVKVCIDICCLSDFDALLETNAVDGHGVYYFVPSLLKHFTAGAINALIAPRAHLSIAGNKDKFTPPLGLDRVDEHLTRVYRELGAGDQWKQSRYPVGHEETAEMRAEMLAFFERWL